MSELSEKTLNEEVIGFITQGKEKLHLVFYEDSILDKKISKEVK